MPELLRALDAATRAPDRLLGAANERASPLLRKRLCELLRAMTGAIVAGDDPQGWRDFWAREQERIVVPERLAVAGDDATRASFFGVPVTGGAVAFLLDTSGSMGDDVDADAPPPGRRAPPTRLATAKAQLLQAAQALPPGTTLQVFTFADAAKAWTEAPVAPTAANLRALTELLSRMRAHGGTDLHQGLVAALGLRGRRFGELAGAPIDELFVLSDGMPTAGGLQDEADILREVREANRYAKVRIHCVFTGERRGADLLRALAEQNGGVFVRR